MNRDHNHDWYSNGIAASEAHQLPRSARRRKIPLRLGRLAAVLLASVIGSLGVAGVSAAVVPEKKPTMMTDPRFDAEVFYKAHAGSRISRDSGRASWPGEQPPPPVARLNQSQTLNAYLIVEVGKQMELPKRAYIVAIATVLQETYLRNLANPTVPSSLKYNNDGTGSDHDSVGLFQQRPSMGWGTVAQLMDPLQASARFYARLIKITGWQALSVGGAAQAVQRSAFPTAYAKHEDHATEIVEALLKRSGG